VGTVATLMTILDFSVANHKQLRPYDSAGSSESRMMKRFLVNETGAKVIEYAVIAAGVSVAIVLVPILRHYGW
jgi:hypothetical protein